MILFGASVSPYSRKVLMYAAEKGIQLEHRPLAPHTDDPAFKAASPTGKIPALQDGDYVLADSTAIVHYLEAKYPDKPLIPREPKALGKTIWFEEYADTMMQPVGSAIFVNRVLLPVLRKIQGDEVKAAEAATQLPAQFAYLESVLPASGYFVNDTLTIADISIVCMLINLNHCRIPVDEAKYPKLAAFYRTMTARSSVSGIIAAECQMLGTFS